MPVPCDLPNGPRLVLNGGAMPREACGSKKPCDDVLGRRDLWLIRTSNAAAAGTREIACSLGRRASTDLFRTKLRALVVQIRHHTSPRFRSSCVVCGTL